MTSVRTRKIKHHKAHNLTAQQKNEIDKSYAVYGVIKGKTNNYCSLYRTKSYAPEEHFVIK